MFDVQRQIYTGTILSGNVSRHLYFVAVGTLFQSEYIFLPSMQKLPWPTFWTIPQLGGNGWHPQIWGKWRGLTEQSGPKLEKGNLLYTKQDDWYLE